MAIGVNRRYLLATSIPSSRSACCPQCPPRIRIAPRPCSGGTILGAWFGNKWHRDKSRSHLSSLCRHHGLSRSPFFPPWLQSHLALRRSVSRPDGPRASRCPCPLGQCPATIRLPETRFPSLDLRRGLPTPVA